MGVDHVDGQDLAQAALGLRVEDDVQGEDDVIRGERVAVAASVGISTAS